MPTPKDIAGVQIVATLECTFRKYMALDSGLPFVLALWTLATHVFDCFDTFPYLAITSPTKRCGKTRLAEIIELLSCGGLRTANASSAAVFRTIQARTMKSQTVTLIMDEMEVLRTNSERAEQLREVLNAGYRRGQSVIRCERTSGDGFEVRAFNVYCPKVLVLIGNLNDTLADRCIPIAMRRRKPGEQVGRFFYTQAKWHSRPLLREVTKWAKANHGKVKRRLRRDVEFLEDREAELWQPLFALCQIAAPERVDELTGIATRISRGKHDEEPNDFGVLLLRDIRDGFNRAHSDRLASSRLLQDLSSVEESPWAGWSNGRGLDARWLARLLRPFRITPHNLRFESGTIAKGYERSDFEDAWATYLPPLPAATALYPSQTEATNESSQPLRSVPVADANSAESE
jgi:hypothetical protein